MQLRAVTCCILLEIVEEMKVRKDKIAKYVNLPNSHEQNIIV